MMSRKSIDELVRADEGLISRSIFVDDEIFHQELERIFAQAWVRKGLILVALAILGLEQDGIARVVEDEPLRPVADPARP